MNDFNVTDRHLPKAEDAADASNKTAWSFKLSKFGVFWLLTSLCIFMLAANFSNNLLLFIAIMMWVLVINSTWFSWLNIRRLTIVTSSVDAMFAEQSGQINVQVANPDGKKHAGVYLHHHQLNQQCLLDESTQKSLIATLSVSGLQRGVYPLSQLQLTSSYPLGLVTWKKAFHSEVQLWVYPEAKGQQPLPKPQAKQGTYLKKEQGDFSHVRNYQRGDSLNHIAWKQMARTGDVMTKEFEGGEGLRQTLLNIKEVNCTDHELQLSQLCQWVLACHQKQLKYSLILGTLTIDAGQGEAHKSLCLQTLAQYH